MPLFLELLRSETAGSPDRLQAALAGLRAYQNAPRAPRPDPRPVIAAAGRAVLRDYGGSGPPLIFVPSLINPPYVLDMPGDRSLLRWLATQGVRPLLLDWQEPGPDDRDLSIAGHVEALLLPLIAALGEPVMLAGYCAGGTMALAATTRASVSALVLMATPWRFAGFPQAARDDLMALWQAAAPAAEQIGLLPMEVLQTSFWRLDPGRSVAKFEKFGTLAPDGAEAQAFIALEDWANDGPPLTAAAGRELLKDFFHDDLPGSGRWSVGGAPVDPAMICCPVLNIISNGDRIVPAASAAEIGTSMRLDSGHVGMVVGGRRRAELWEPLAYWLSQVRNS